MGHFTNNQLFSGAQHDVPVYEGYDVEFGGGYTAVTEAFEDSLELVKIVCEMDNAELALKSGAISADRFETVYEAAIGNFFAKAKEALKKLWGKIKAFFDSIIRRLRAMFGDTKKFVDKYADELRKLKLNGMKAKKYDYADLATVVEGLTKTKTIAENEMSHTYKTTLGAVKTLDKGQLDAARTKLKENEKGLFAEMIKATGSKADTVEKLNTEIFRDLRNGARGAEDMKEIDVNISAIIDEVKETPELIKKLEDAHKDITEVIKTGIENIDALASAVDGAEVKDTSASYDDKDGNTHVVHTDAKTAASAYIRSQSTVINTFASIANKVVSATRSAVEERNSANKKIINSALKFKEKK